MKILRSIFVSSLAAVAALCACERMVDFQTVVDAPAVLVYSQSAGEKNTAVVTVSHTPVGSYGSFSTVFDVNCNSGSHAAAKVEVYYCPFAAEDYIAKNGLKCSVLPEKYLRIAKYVEDDDSTEPGSEAVLTLPENARVTVDSVKISLVGDLSELQERMYVAAVKIAAGDISGSEVSGTYYIKVLAEKNSIKPITSSTDISGFSPSDYSGMEYIAGLSGSINDSQSLPAEPVEVKIDLHDTYLVTGFLLGLQSPGYYGAPKISAIEYSEDGKEWEQAGTPESILIEGNEGFIGFYGAIKSRYLKMTVDASVMSQWARTLNYLHFRYIESMDPMVYLNETEYADEIRHTPAGSESSMAVNLNVFNTIPTGKSITVTAAQDNSLVAGYNQKHGTKYETVPVSNVKIEGSAVIAAQGSQASKAIVVRLQGDLSKFNSEAGYLIPVKLSSGDAEVSKTKGVAYIVVRQRTVYLRSDFTESQIGAPKLANKSAWVLTGTAPSWSGQLSELIDGNYDTSYTYYTGWGAASGPEWTIELDKVYDFYGVGITVGTEWDGSASVEDFELLVSTDGSAYESLGTPSMTDKSICMNGTTGMAALYGPKKAKYVKIKYSYYYKDFAELDIYAK